MIFLSRLLLAHIMILVVMATLVGCSSLTQVAGVKSKKRPLLIRWAKNLDPVYNTGNLPIGLSSPKLHRGLLFLGNPQGNMVAYDLDTGREVWKKHDGATSYNSSPSIFREQLVYGTNSGRIYSRHYLTGKLKFSVDLGSSIETAPVFYRGRLFVHLRNHKVFALDAATGKILWAYRRSVPFTTTIQRSSRPTIKNNKLYVGFADGYVVSFSVDDGVILWEQKIATGSKFIDVDVRPIIKGNYLYVGPAAGPLTVLSVKTGNIIRRLKYVISRAPIVSDSSTILGTVDGKIVRLNKYDKEVRVKDLKGGSISSMVHFKKFLVVTTMQGYLYLLDKRSFAVKYKKHFGSVASSFFGQIKISKDKFTIYSARNRLYVFSLRQIL